MKNMRSPCPHVPSPSTGGQGRPWPRCRAVDVVDYCAHKQVRYRRQINSNRPSTVSERCKAGHTCHASAQKTVKVQIDTPPASPSRTASLPAHGSVDSLVWSQRLCLLPSRSVRLEFALGVTSAVEGRPCLAQRLFFSLSPPNNSAAHPQHPPFAPQLATRSPTSLICQDV